MLRLAGGLSLVLAGSPASAPVSMNLSQTVAVCKVSKKRCHANRNQNQPEGVSHGRRTLRNQKLQTGEVADYRVASQGAITKAAASFYLRQCCLPYRLHPVPAFAPACAERISTFPFPARLAICLLFSLLHFALITHPTSSASVISVSEAIHLLTIYLYYSSLPTR